MPKLHEIYPEAYESCGHCSGSGKKVEVRNDETRQIDCPRCGGTGRIKKSTGIKPDPSSADYRSPTISKPIARTKEELKTRFEEALAKAKQLQKSLLDAIQSSLQLSSEMMYSSHKFISSIDPLSKDVKESLEKL